MNLVIYATEGTPIVANGTTVQEIDGAAQVALREVTPARTNLNGNTYFIAKVKSRGVFDDTGYQVLGTYKEIFADPAKEAIYATLHDRTPYDDGAGNMITPPDRFGMLSEPPVTVKNLKEALDIRLTEEAEARGFKSIEEAATYANETQSTRLQTKAKKLRRYRSLTRDLLNDIRQGTTPMPDSVDDFIDDLPSIP